MRRTRAFTLLEVLLALGLVGMLAGSIFGFMWNVLRVRDALALDSRDAQAGAAVMERIESDMLCGLAGDEGVGAGITGTAMSLKVLTRGVAIPTGPKTEEAGDLQWSEFAFDRASGVIKARRGKVGSPAEFEVVSEHLEWARLRYFDGKQWTESFDSLRAGGLPVAVEVALWFGPVWREDGVSLEHAPAAESDAAGPEGVDSEPLSEAKAGPRVAATSTPAGPTREPDRLRVVVMPDGPVASWKEGS